MRYVAEITKGDFSYKSIQCADMCNDFRFVVREVRGCSIYRLNLGQLIKMSKIEEIKGYLRRDVIFSNSILVYNEMYADLEDHITYVSSESKGHRVCMCPLGDLDVDNNKLFNYGMNMREDFSYAFKQDYGEFDCSVVEAIINRTDVIDISDGFAEVWTNSGVTHKFKLDDYFMRKLAKLRLLQ